MTTNNPLAPPTDLESNLTTYGFVSNWAKETPDAVSISAPGRPDLSYQGLQNQIKIIAITLNGLDIKRNDRVAIILPNGPEMAVAFLAVSSCATCAPLRPNYREKEYNFFLSDLNAKALILPAGLDNPAVNVAKKMGLKIIHLTYNERDPAGIFKLEEEAHHSRPEFAFPEDIALVLHTSGTTSRPKSVPLKHKNLCTSALNIRNALGLKQNDRCLNIMPLFHIHGLIGALLSSISSGGSIVCTPGFYAPRFFDWLDQYRPTWYTAVPTMHQAILLRTDENMEIIKRPQLRFIRSSSSALAPKVMADLQRVFQVPVVESYGMTEASHQIASNPLPPGTQKAGSVGLAAGPEIAIMDEKGDLLPQGEIDEIVIRGPNVTSGYENNPTANKEAFTKGWFRTGDEGYFDNDGYLILTGRLKEIINRGGEKISPREIDELLLQHPEISEAVAFAVPHPKLGEDIAVAIVLREGVSLTREDIQNFVYAQLADFKVPRYTLFLDEIPKGTTGKIQRIGLSEKLGLSSINLEKAESKTKYKPPSREIEKKLIEIWSEVLGVEQVGINDNYFQLGGDSILAGLIIAKISEEIGIKQIEPVIFLHAPTIEQMAVLLEKKELVLPSASLVNVQPGGSNQPIYFVHPNSGDVDKFHDLARYLPDHPFFGFRAQGLDGRQSPYEDINEMASHYLREIMAIQPEGPYILGGVEIGGLIAWEMTRQFLSIGKKVETLFLINTLPPHFSSIEIGKVSGLLRRIASMFSRRHKVRNALLRAAKNYNVQASNDRVVLSFSKKSSRVTYDPETVKDAWAGLISRIFEITMIPGDESHIFTEPNVRFLANSLRTSLHKTRYEDSP